MAIIKEKLHPAANIANIKTAIPVVLDYEGTNYTNWATLFTLHCRANLVLDHIVPPANEDEKRATQAQWQQEDDIVRQWIYATISKELLNKIISPDDTAAKAWNRLVNMFHANETASVCHLEAQFNNISLKDFANVKEYCTRIKVLAEKLKNFGKLITDERMVLRLLDGLTDEYKGFKSAFQHRATLPSFDTVQSMLFEEASNDESTVQVHKIQSSMLEIEEEASNKNVTSQGSYSAFISQSNADNLSSVGQKYQHKNPPQNCGNAAQGSPDNKAQLMLEFKETSNENATADNSSGVGQQNKPKTPPQNRVSYTSQGSVDHTVQSMLEVEEASNNSGTAQGSVSAFISQPNVDNSSSAGQKNQQKSPVQICGNTAQGSPGYKVQSTLEFNEASNESNTAQGYVSTFVSESNADMSSTVGQKNQPQNSLKNSSDAAQVSPDQNSALVLSLWHCKLAWFFADSANKNVRRISAARVTHKAIDSIYKSMIPLSSAIHGRLQKSTNIPKMVEPIKNIVSGFGISLEEWVTELHSLMEELVSINQVLKDYQQRQNFTDKSSRNTLRNSIEHIQKEPKYTVCLLTIWYWLAVWCSPEDHHHYHSPTGEKYEFMSAIQSHHEMLATCLVNPSTTDSKGLPELQKLFSMLIEMLKSDLQYWIDALDQFTDKMANAGILRGQVREVLRAKGALKDRSTLLKASEKMSNTCQGRSQLKYLHKKDILKDQVRDAMIDKQTLDLMEMIGDIVVNSHHDLKDVKDVVVDVAVITEEYGEEVVEFAEKDEHGKHSIHLDVLQLADTIGEGINHFAEGAGSVCHKFGSFFKTTF